MVKKFQAHRVGSSDPVKPGEAQDFKEFYATSQVERYWMRAIVFDNRSLSVLASSDYRQLWRAVHVLPGNSIFWLR